MQQAKYHTIVILFLLLFLASCAKKKQTESAVLATVSIPSVQAIIAKPAQLQNLIFTTGSIMANESVEIRPEIQGRITSILFKEGERVAAGKLLVKLDNSELIAQSNRIKLSIDLAEADALRKKQILAINGISEEELEIATNTVLKLKTDQQLIEAQIAKTTLFAPFAGIIGLRSVSEGSYVSPSTLITQLQQTDPIKIEFSIPEKYATQLEIGSQIEFTVEGNTSTFKAKVYAKEPKIDASTRTIKVRAQCSNANNVLIPGAFAKIQINLQTIKDALVVPTQALLPGITGQSLLIVRQNKASNTPIQIGIRNETEVQITEGVGAGDTIIITGLLTVRNGASIKVVVVDSLFSLTK